MKVICDTNIWYYLGEGKIEISSINTHIELNATYINIYELSRTPNLLKHPEKVRAALKYIFKNQTNILFIKPMTYIKMLAESNFTYNSRNEQSELVEFAQCIANGDKIDESKKDEFLELSKKMSDKFHHATNDWNSLAKDIKSRKINKSNHRKVDTTDMAREFISKLVSIGTNSDGLPINFNWSNIELFVNCLCHFFIELEISQMLIQPNDWNDLFQLIYVQPDMKYWTKEKRWINIIEKANMNKYLYIPNN